MALHKAIQVINRLPLPSADGATGVIAIVGDWTVPANTATGDVVEMGGLPAGYVPVDVIVDPQDLGGTFVADLGLLTGAFNGPAPRLCGNQFAAAVDLGTAGIKRATSTGAGRIAPAEQDRGVGFALTNVVGPSVGTVVRLTMLARPAYEGA
jgi:hypothetical protein